MLIIHLWLACLFKGFVTFRTYPLQFFLRIINFRDIHVLWRSYGYGPTSICGARGVVICNFGNFQNFAPPPPPPHRQAFISPKLFWFFFNFFWIWWMFIQIYSKSVKFLNDFGQKIPKKFGSFSLLRQKHSFQKCKPWLKVDSNTITNLF